MSRDQLISDHYEHGNLIQAINAALSRAGKSPDSINIEDLAAVDEFHIGGRQATDHLLDKMNLGENHLVVDIGCGLGGAARYVASRFDNKVAGIDLTSEYIETGRVLNQWVKLDQQIRLEQGSALSMPFDTDSFDAGYMLHVGMNIEDKDALFTEIYRVLKSGSCFGVYDVMRQNEDELIYPVPWATDSSTSYLATPEQYKQALTDAGFEIFREDNRHEFALDFFAKLRAKSEARGGPPPLGLHTLMGKSTEVKINNMIDNLSANRIAPVELIVIKPNI